MFCRVCRNAWRIKFFLFQSGARRSLHAVRGHCPLKWPRMRKKGRVGVYERFLVSRRRRRRRRSGFLDGSSRLVDGRGYGVCCGDSGPCSREKRALKRDVCLAGNR